MNLIIFLFVGIAAGYIAGMVLRGGGYGFAGNLMIGILGAFCGGFFQNLLGLSPFGMLGAFFTAILGASLMLLLVSLLKRA